jgi:hypothetical protein
MPIQTWQQTLVTAQADGTALTAAAAATCIPAQAKFTLPANFFDTIGKQVIVKASGRITSLITTPGTARFDVRFGANVVADSQAILLDTVAAHTNVGWYLEMLLTCRVVGAAASLMQSGIWVCEDILGVPATAPKGVVTALLPWNAAPAVGATFDSTTSQVVDFFFTQTVATGSMTLHQYSLISLN